MTSKIIIANNIKLDKNYNNVIDYTENEMLQLIEKNKVTAADDYTFIRTNNNSISVSFKYSDCIKCNYIAFQNKDYCNKWFFGWIDDVIFKGEKTTEIIYTIDVWSTWFKTLNICKCFVEREHTNNDTIGFNIVPEDINTGEMVCEKYNKYNFGGIKSNPYALIISSSIYLNGEYKGNKAKLITPCYGSYTPNIWYLLKNPTEIIDFIYKVTGINDFDDLFRDTSKGINNIFAIPHYMADKIEINTETKEINIGQMNAFSDELKIDKVISYNDYKPKNNKLFTYPFNYLRLTNLQGQYINLQYELFNNEITFNIIGTITESGCDILCIPKNYCNVEKNYESSISCGKFPTISWASESYKSWLNKNMANDVGTAVTSVLGLLTNQPVLTIGGVTQMIGNNISSQLNIMNTPNNISGLNTSGDIMSSTCENTFHFYSMRPKTENLKIIDDYFSKYGYKTNQIKSPNITGRKNFNYVKIGDKNSVVYGNIPTKYIDKINNIFISGVTIWHNHENLGNYDIENDII